MSRFRILSLDGGGVRGVYAAAFLAELEQLTGRTVVDYFDLVVGTSTGGLIALGLGLRKSPAEIRDFYVNHGPVIFGSDGRVARAGRGIRHIFAAKHDGGTLESALKSLVGETTKLGESGSRLVIPAFNATKGLPQCFKTAHHPEFQADRHRPAWEVGMATSAAPSYFKAFECSDQCAYIDGGIWANSPVLVGVVEAITRLSVTVSDIDVLSIGTTRKPQDIAEDVRNGGLWKNRYAAGMVIDASQSAAQLMAGSLIGRQNLVHVNDVITDPAKLDDVGGIPSLIGLAKERAKTEYVAVAARFLDAPAPEFKPYPTAVSVSAATLADKGIHEVLDEQRT